VRLAGVNRGLSVQNTLARVWKDRRMVGFSVRLRGILCSGVRAHQRSGYDIKK